MIHNKKHDISQNLSGLSGMCQKLKNQSFIFMITTKKRDTLQDESTTVLQVLTMQKVNL